MSIIIIRLSLLYQVMYCTWIFDINWRGCPWECVSFLIFNINPSGFDVLSKYPQIYWIDRMRPLVCSKNFLETDDRSLHVRQRLVLFWHRILLVRIMIIRLYQGWPTQMTLRLLWKCIKISWAACTIIYSHVRFKSNINIYLNKYIFKKCKTFAGHKII